MAERVVTELVIDGSQAEAALGRVEQAYGHLGDRAEAASAKAILAMEKQTQIFGTMPQAILRVGNAYDSLRGRLDPVVAAQMRAEQEMTKSLGIINRAVLLNITTEEQAARDIALLRQKQVLDINRVRDAQVEANNSVKRLNVSANQNDAPVDVRNNNRFAAFNAAQQIQDIFVTAQMGQKVSTIALQQGLQLGSALQMGLGNQGATGIVKGLGAAFLSILSPINLVAIGITGLAAAGIEYGLSWYNSSKKVEDATKDQIKNLGDLKKAYQDSNDASKENDRNATNVVILRNQQSSEQLRRLVEQSRNLIDNKTPQQIDEGPYKGLNAQIFASMPDAPVNDALKEFTKNASGTNAEFYKLRDTMVSIAGDTRLDKKVREEADGFLKLAEEATKAIDALRLFDNRPGTLAAGRKLEREGVSDTQRRSLEQYYLEQNIAAERARQAQSASIQGIDAKSPEERAAAARAAAAAQYVGDESSAARALRIEQTGTLALIKSTHDLAEAQKQRNRALDDSISNAQLEISLVGKSATETARLKMEHQLLADLQRTADQNHIQADVNEIARIREKSAQYARLNGIAEAANYNRGKDEEIAKLRLEQQLVGTSILVRQQSIATYEAELEIRHRGIDAQGEEARHIRENAKALSSVTLELERQNDAWGKVKSTGEGVIDSLLSGDWKSALQDIEKTILEIGVSNPLKNAMLGTNKGTLSDLGGFSGLISKLFGGADAGAGDAIGAALDATAVGSMSVTAGTVMINGGVGGGLGGVAGSLLSEKNYAPGAITKSALGNLTTGSMADYRAAIKAVESLGSGGYSALGPITAKGDQAIGAYQVMRSNIPSWTKSALGHSMSASQFLHNPGAQDAVFDHQFGKSLTKYGNPQDAASVWFTGRPQTSGAGARDILGTSGSGYVEKFNTALGKLSNTTNASTLNVAKIGQVAGQSSSSLGAFSSGLGKLGNTLSQSTSGGGGGGGIFGFLGKMLGGLFGGNANAFPAAPPAPLEIGGLFAGGGDIWGAGTGTSDSIPILASTGEHITNAKSAAKYRPLLHAINNDTLGRFAAGGFVSSKSFVNDNAVETGGINKSSALNVTFVNNGTPQREVERRQEDDGQGGRRTILVLDDAIAANIGRAGSASGRSVSAYGGKRQTVMR